MDSTTILIGVTFIVIMIFPIIMMSKISKQRDKKQILVLKEMAGNFNCTVTDHDTWNNYAIGIDKINHMLFYSNSNKEIPLKHSVKLNEFRNCHISNSANSSNSKTGHQKVISNIRLTLQNNKQDQSDIHLEFYNIDFDNLTLNDELILASKWQEVINKEISAISQLKKRA